MNIKLFVLNSLLLSLPLGAMELASIEVQETPNSVLHKGLIHELSKTPRLLFPNEINELIAQYALFTEDQEKEIIESIAQRRGLNQHIILRDRECCHMPERKDYKRTALLTLALMAIAGGFTYEIIWLHSRSLPSPPPKQFCTDINEINTPINAVQTWRATAQGCGACPISVEESANVLTPNIFTSPLQCASTYNSTKQLAYFAQNQLQDICGPQAVYCAYVDDSDDACISDNLASFKAALNGTCVSHPTPQKVKRDPNFRRKLIARSKHSKKH